MVPVEMNGIELLEETNFRLLGHSYTQSIAKAASRKMGSLYRDQRFLAPESSLYRYKSTIRPCMDYCISLIC